MLQWLPGILASIGTGALTAMLMMWRRQAVVDTRLELLEKFVTDRTTELARADENGAGELKSAAQELHHVAAELTAMAREQAVINTVVSKSLQGITDKIEAHGMVLADHEANLKYLVKSADSIHRQAIEKAGA